MHRTSKHIIFCDISHHWVNIYTSLNQIMTSRLHGAELITLGNDLTPVISLCHKSKLYIFFGKLYLKILSAIWRPMREASVCSNACNIDDITANEIQIERPCFHIVILLGRLALKCAYRINMTLCYFMYLKLHTYAIYQGLS